MYHRLLTRVIDTPLFISQDKLDVISERVLVPLLVGQMVPKNLPESERPGRQLNSQAIGVSGPDRKTNTASIIPVMDTLFSKNGAGLSGATTYESIANQIDQAVNNGSKQIGFWIDSPGGEAFGLFPLMEKIRNLADQGIQTFAFTDGMMTSAAYGIASATQKIYAVEGSVVGSIGTVLTHIDRTEADDKAGLSYTIFRSKPQKALGNSHEPLTEEISARFESLLAKMDSMFNNEILKGRSSLTLEQVVQMEGSEFLATDGLNLNLVDSIVPTFDSAFLSFNKQPKGAMKMNEEELLEKLAAANNEVATLKGSIEQSIKLAVLEERNRVITLHDNAAKLNISQDLLLRHIEKGYSSEASLEIMTEIREAKETATAINGSTSLQGTVQNDLGTDKPSLKSAYRQATGRRAE